MIEFYKYLYAGSSAPPPTPKIYPRNGKANQICPGVQLTSHLYGSAWIRWILYESARIVYTYNSNQFCESIRNEFQMSKPECSFSVRSAFYLVGSEIRKHYVIFQ